MPQNKPTQAILINVPTRRRGRIGRTAQKRKAPTETAATLPFNDGASTFLAGEPNLSEANQTIKSLAQDRRELFFHNLTGSEVVTREGRTETHFYHHIENQQSMVHRPEHHQGRHGGYGQNSQHYGTTNPTMV